MSAVTSDPGEIGGAGLLRRWALLRASSDARVVRSRPDVARFLALGAQLGLLIATFVLFRVEEPTFIIMMGMVALSFCIHYWLPFVLKEPFLIAVSIGSAFILLEPLVAGLLMVAGALIFSVIISPLPFIVRAVIIVVIGAAAMYMRSGGDVSLGIPASFWPVAGSIFMFRLIIYMYDLRHASLKPRLQEYLSYFFIIPNYYFLLFPVIDLQTMRKSYFSRDINIVAQEGIEWIFKGLIQLILYRLVYHYQTIWSPSAITDPIGLARNALLIYLLYLHVSGSFHIIVGILHLFGYDLPETHRRYLLASSLTDFWRRINIYWKDFMVKCFYFPVYFRLRRKGEVRAQVIATAIVFVSTWALHSYQYFWLSGAFLLSETDIAFWAILGVLVIVNVLLETRRGRKRSPAARSAARGKALETAKTIGTFMLIVTLWSLWNTPTISQWLDILTWWRLG